MSKSLSGSVCLNHPQVPAMVRCATCSKPICQECVQLHDKVSYCSQLCYENALRTGVMVEDVKRRKKAAELKRFLRLVISLLFLVAILAAGYWLYRRHQGQVDGSWKNLQQTIEEKAAATADGIKSRTVDRESNYKRRTEGALKD